MIREFEVSKWDGKKIVIYGAGAIGKKVANFLSKKSVTGFCYADKEKAGQIIDGVCCINPQNIDDDSIVILGSERYIYEMFKNLINRGISYNRIFYATNTIFDDEKKDKIHSFSEVTSLYNYIKNKMRIEADINDGWYIPNLDVVITEKCTLRCKNCCECIPDYVNPQNIDIRSTVHALNSIIMNNAWIGNLAIMGGEPFSNQQAILEILKEYGNNPHVGSVNFTTNGTIIPNEMTCREMKKCKYLYVIFSNYGYLSRLQNDAVYTLENNDIDFCIEEESDFDASVGNLWIDYGKLIHYDRDTNITKKMFNECLDAKFCTTMLKDKLFLCPRISHGYNMGIITDDDAKYLDINEFEREGNEGAKTLFLDWYNDENYPGACEWCNKCSKVLVERAAQI